MIKQIPFFILPVFFLITPVYLFVQIVEYHPEVDTLFTNTTAEPYYEWSVNNTSLNDSLSLQVFEMPDHDYPSVFNSPEIQGEFDNFYLLIENDENDLSYRVEYSIDSHENDFQDIPSDSFYYIDHPGLVYFKFVVLSESERVDSVMITIEQQFGLSVEYENLPTQISLSQNYPNPFNPYTSIRFDLREHAAISLMVYDLLGREVARLIDFEQLPSGTHQRIWEPSPDIGSGIYIYQVKADGQIKTRKMTLIK
ncbi:hypothetical protein BH23BAC3_BH23BAC3_26470 [soil metagenome]